MCKMVKNEGRKGGKAWRIRAYPVSVPLPLTLVQTCIEAGACSGLVYLEAGHRGVSAV